MTEVKSHRSISQTAMISDEQGFGIVMSRGLETPAGTQIRVLQVQVEVRLFGPLLNPYPQCGSWVTCTVLQQVES